MEALSTLFTDTGKYSEFVAAGMYTDTVSKMIGNSDVRAKLLSKLLQVPDVVNSLLKFPAKTGGDTICRHTQAAKLRRYEIVGVVLRVHLGLINGQLERDGSAAG